MGCSGKGYLVVGWRVDGGEGGGVCIVLGE